LVPAQLVIASQLSEVDEGAVVVVVEADAAKLLQLKR